MGANKGGFFPYSANTLFWYIIAGIGLGVLKYDGA